MPSSARISAGDDVVTETAESYSPKGRARHGDMDQTKSANRWKALGLFPSKKACGHEPSI